MHNNEAEPTAKKSTTRLLIPLEDLGLSEKELKASQCKETAASRKPLQLTSLNQDHLKTLNSKLHSPLFLEDVVKCRDDNQLDLLLSVANKPQKMSNKDEVVNNATAPTLMSGKQLNIL